MTFSLTKYIINEQLLHSLVTINILVGLTDWINKWAWMPHRHSKGITAIMASGLVVTLIVDFWPWKPFQQFPLTWWISMASSLKSVHYV